MPASHRRRWAAIVLAAGAGRRMGSKLPKPLCPVGGRAMVLRVVDALVRSGIKDIIAVIGHRADQVRAGVLADLPAGASVLFTIQKHQLGTGDAVRAGLTAVREDSGVADVIVANGDMPLLQAGTITELIKTHTKDAAEMTLATAHFDNPSGYGRILRKAGGGIAKIVEEPAATAEQKTTGEINVGVYCFRITTLNEVLPRLRPANPRAELYLTDLVDLLVCEGRLVSTMAVADPVEALGVNDDTQLAACERTARGQATTARGGKANRGGTVRPEDQNKPLG